jgi:hypothetical protein
MTERTMTPPPIEAVERVKALADRLDREAQFHRVGGLIPGKGSPDGNALRALLSTNDHLSSENARLEAEVTNLRATQGEELARIGVARECERDEWRAEITRLREALRPLADCEIIEPDTPLPDSVLARYAFTMGEIRAARAALDPPAAATPGEGTAQ